MAKNEREIFIAPCPDKDGRVFTLDLDTKEGICLCPANPAGCLVDGRNHLLEPQTLLGPVATSADGATA